MDWNKKQKPLSVTLRVPPPPKGEARGGAEHHLLALPMGELSKRSETERVFCADFLFCNSPFSAALSLVKDDCCVGL